MLSNVSVGQSEDWDDHLDRVLLTYRPSVHHTTGATPCRIMYGKKLRCRTWTEGTTAFVQTTKWKKNEATVRGCILEGKTRITVVCWLEFVAVVDDDGSQPTSTGRLEPLIQNLVFPSQPCQSECCSTDRRPGCCPL
ncbi:conserved hypothetical protein [Trichinella spiralis]|uniref:hypothetical protein n=1 Tax=Trichinella spiralis TaxID=6334 RepID=UPI0001EFC6D7|nr:conserved hypothetical protein [Trichinella spiralis]